MFAYQEVISGKIFVMIIIGVEEQKVFHYDQLSSSDLLLMRAIK